MLLTAQMLDEIDSIQTRLNVDYDQVWIPMLEGWKKRGGFLTRDKNTAHATIAELNPYKIRLENMLCQTDIKEQAR